MLILRDPAERVISQLHEWNKLHLIPSFHGRELTPEFIEKRVAEQVKTILSAVCASSGSNISASDTILGCGEGKFILYRKIKEISYKTALLNRATAFLSAK